ncbi:hypothetical protein CP532_6574 [Ophiocordyceps camponoti-leonardi (nom. inval.)]|nr:hypothetical protein CP532_6574 [Ophiocordyceps camponoti-leonardi (nom. inval.)]
MAGWVTDDGYSTGLGIIDRSPAQDVQFRAYSRTSNGSPQRNGSRSSPVRMAEGLGDEAALIDPSRDESISILDPRRFTPTLHANLVSEILALRREQEEKTTQIDSLEFSLHTAKEDQERSQRNFAEAAKENRSLKRQLALLEGGTASALGELARERDEAVDSTTEIKRRLEAAQKKIRIQEDDSQRVHDLWEQEKISWENERRGLKRKLHVTESRLKTVVDELAAFQQSTTHNEPPIGHPHDSDAEHSDHGSQVGSHRTMSITNSIRRSLYSPGPELHHGQCLADELDFDDEHTDIDGRESVLSHHTSPKPIKRSRRNQSLDSLRRNGSLPRGRSFGHRIVSRVREDSAEKKEEARPVPPPPIFVDTGIQYSPPPSPEPRTTTKADIVTRKKLSEIENPRVGGGGGDSEIEANQRRKRVQVCRPVKMVVTPTPIKAEEKMVSAAAQTVEEPLSPPKTPKTPRQSLSEDRLPVMVSSSTQTEEREEEEVVVQQAKPPTSAPLPLSIPSISVEPPRSRPTTPRSPRLPQYTKNVGCQADLPPAPTRDASVQTTQGIQVDQRLARLPLHLRPSNISSRPSSPARDKNFTPVPGDPPARNPRRLTQGGDAPDSPPTPTASHTDGEVLYDTTYRAHDGDEDDDDNAYGNHPLSRSRRGSTRRSRRVSSLFAGFDTASSDGMDEFGDLYVSDVEYRTALSAPKPPPSKTSRPSKRWSPTTMMMTPTQPLREELPESPSRNSGLRPASPELYSSFSLVDKENRIKNPTWRPGRSQQPKSYAPVAAATSVTTTASDRNGAMRRTAMIQSGIASHQMRSRSPSWPDSGLPPFPIPKRASSRKPAPADTDAQSDGGQSSPTRVEGGRPRAGGGGGGRNSGRQSAQSRNIRKVRSAVVLSRDNQRRRRQGSRSPPPPPMSPSTQSPEAMMMGLPPLPDNDITAPPGGNNRDVGKSGRRKGGHRHQPSTNTELTSRTSGSQTTGVVDAIAHTMVGEWMLKYVRRRRSFGIPDSTGKDDTSNDRHKRWVWLAPYERAILWSSKQPSSGSALMGKSGRKCTITLFLMTIQSVLDVKDDNPAPKVMPSVFNRSILILTPQRALKFTATSADRHYLWLTALSFLAHSSHAVPEMLVPPHLNVKQQQQQQQQQRQQQQQSAELEIPRGRFRAGGIRDSIRLAKGKSGGSKTAPQEGEDEVGGNAAGHSREPSGEAAEPPLVPRFSDRVSHGRKRSNTAGGGGGGGGGGGTVASFRGYSAPLGHQQQQPHFLTHNGSIATVNSEFQSQASTWNMSSQVTATSPPLSEASTRQQLPSQFLDTIGTVRMEAFISPLSWSKCPDDEDEDDNDNGDNDEPEEVASQIRGRRGRKKKRSRGGPRGRQEYDDGGNRGLLLEEVYREDPFKGF